MTPSAVDHAAYSNRLHEIPVEFLTVENLTSTRDYDGDTALHRAARSGQLKYIPAEVLKKAVFAQNNFGSTPFRLAASGGFLDQIPVELLTWENLSKQNANGESILDTASKEVLAQIPENPLMKRVEDGTISQVPNDELAKWLFVRNPKTGQTPFRMAALHGNLGTLPAEFLTKQNLLSTKEGFCYLHVTDLEKFPPGILTEEMLLAKNDSGTTVLEAYTRSHPILSLNPDMLSQAAVKHLRETFQNSEKPKDVAFLRMVASWQKKTPEGTRLRKSITAYAQIRKGDPTPTIEAITKRLFSGETPTELDRAHAKWASGTSKGKASGNELLAALKAYDSIHKEPTKAIEVAKS